MKYWKLIVNSLLLIIFILIFIFKKGHLVSSTYAINYFVLRDFVFVLIGGIGILNQYHNIMNNLKELNLNARYYAIIFSIINLTMLILFTIFIGRIAFHNPFIVIVGDAVKTYYQFILAIFGVVGIYIQHFHIKDFIKYANENWMFIF